MPDRPAGRWGWLLHPLLVAAYFVLTLAAGNAESLEGWSDLAWPLATVLGFAAMAWVIAWLLCRNPGKASLLATLWTIGFSVYGYVANSLVRAGSLHVVGDAAGLCVLFVVILFGPSVAVARARRSLDPFNRYATVVATLLVGYTGWQLARGLADQGGSPVAVPSAARGSPADANAPDIYLLILDQYTGGDALRRGFGYDNTAFEDTLRSRGFIVPRHPRANYPQTPLSLASMLNLDYVQHLPAETHLYDLIEHNRLAAFLQQRGYRFVFLPTGFKFTARNRHADLELPAPAQVGSEFAGVWQRTTMMPELLQGACRLLGCRAGRLVYVSEDATLVDWKFERLGTLADSTRPSFVFAHLGITHEPYLYHRDCRHRDPYWPADGGLPGDGRARQAYLDQIECANRKLLALVDAIKHRAPRPSVILFQADHGHGRLGRHLPPVARLSPDQVRERMSAFAAYLLPGLDAREISDSITPVNALRLVVRHYFAADLPPLQDVMYWSTGARRASVVPVAAR